MGCCCAKPKENPVLEQNSSFKEELLANDSEKVVQNVLQPPALPDEELAPEVHVEPAIPYISEEVEKVLEMALPEPGTPTKSEISTKSFESLPIDMTPISTRSNTTSLRRTSSAVTKEHREFRIFLPRINEATDSWLTTEQKNSYIESLAKLVTSLNKNDKKDDEVRDDTYLISQSYYNLKYRDDQKLEMKVKTPNKPIWQEKWNIVKFGKKPMKHYRTDIITYLHDVGHVSEENADYIDNPRYLTVSKSRNLSSFEENKVSVEVCDIDVAPTKYTPKKQSKFDDQIRRQKWVSISIAGDSKSIESFVVAHHEATALWESLSYAKTLYIDNKDVAFKCNFVPVVAGYSQWVRLMANEISTTEGVEEEISPSVDAFLEFLSAEEEM